MRKVGGNNRASEHSFHPDLSFGSFGPGMSVFHAPRQTSPGLDLPTSGLHSAGIVGLWQVSVTAEGGCATTADRKSEQGSKEEIAKGMAEAGKDTVGRAGGEAAKKGGHGHGADPGKISQGMSEAGSGTGAGTKGSRGGPKGRAP